MSGQMELELNWDEVFQEEKKDAGEAKIREQAEAEEIYVTLGSPWVPPSVIDRFIYEVIGGLGNYDMNRLPPVWKTTYEPELGLWEVPGKSRFGWREGWSGRNFGTLRLKPLQILEKTLNMRPVKVTEEIFCDALLSGKTRVLNVDETVFAQEKQRAMIDAFKNWVWKDPKRKKELEGIFYSRYSSKRKRMYDGSGLTFPGMSREIELYPYQKDAVARILLTPNTLLAHDVGTGKTYIMIAAGMELLRLGHSKKNLYVLPNNLVSQWEGIFKRLYPQAKLLCVEPKHFTPAKRNEVLKQIREEQFDGILMSYSCFGLIRPWRDEKNKTWRIML